MNGSEISDLRQRYSKGCLDEGDLLPDPMATFEEWFQLACSTEAISEPNAMTLASADADGVPSARTVLLKGLSPNGFRFFTNFESRKGQELMVNPRAALVFLWKPLERQVCVRGVVEKVSSSEADAYFKSRPYESQIGAWASQQSHPVADRAALEEREAEFRDRFPEGAVPLPNFWGGFELEPLAIEFWQGRPGRLHDRFLFEREDVTQKRWKIQRLAP